MNLGTAIKVGSAIGKAGGIVNHSSSTTTTRRHGNDKGGGGGGCCGIVLIVLGGLVLYWNEGRAVRTYRDLVEGLTNVVEKVPDVNNNVISSSSSSNKKLDDDDDGKLVHMVGTVEGKSAIVDTEFNINLDRAIKLRRTVEMYQWKETYDNSGSSGGGKANQGYSYYYNKTTTNDTTTTTAEYDDTYYYTYEQIWSTMKISSSKFHQPGYDNPDYLWPCSSTTMQSSSVVLGVYEPSSDIVKDHMNWYTYYTPSSDVNMSSFVDDKIPNGVALFFGANNNPSNPTVGDLRITFDVVLPSLITILAKQQENDGTSLVPYTTKGGNTLVYVLQGSYTAEEIFQKEQASNAFVTHLFRLIGFAIMTIGVKGMVSPLAYLFDSIPCSIIGRCLGETILPFLTVLVSGLLSGVVIAIAWLRYHPIAGLFFIVCVCGLFYWIIQKSREQHQQQQQNNGDEDLELVEEAGGQGGSGYSD